MAFSKNTLSGSTNGRQIKVGATATPGTLIHTAVAGISQIDIVTLYAQNNHTSAVTLTIEFGGTSSPDDLIIISLPSKAGLELVVPGLPLNNGLSIRAFAGTANVICISGHVVTGP